MIDSSSQETLQKLARNLRMLLLDVDGVLTDGGIILIGQEGEAKRFDVQDGMGINLAKAAGLIVGEALMGVGHTLVELLIGGGS